MGAPIRSRISDFVEPGGLPEPEPAAEPRRSRLRDLVEAAPPAQPDADGRPGPRPGVPAYGTPVLVPAHPRSVGTTGTQGGPARVPFVVLELFEHPAHGTVVFAFSTPQRLADALGEAQPWVAASIGPLAESVREQGVTVLLDPSVPPGRHNWRPADLVAYAQEVRR
ncbi:SAV_915 family protein [Streptomyces sp. NPDC005728]|uniref:SAV_915 family protein n=1 Tax=Streptomyces sp. NPDC005728 TaxID=3157054 RepID=UPI0033FFA2A2